MIKDRGQTGECRKARPADLYVRPSNAAASVGCRGRERGRCSITYKDVALIIPPATTEVVC